MRAFYLIPTRTGTGTDSDPIRPSGVGGLSSWAACYDRASQQALVLAEVTDPKQVAGTFLGLLTDTQNATGALQATVAAKLKTFSGAADPSWGDTMVGDYRREDTMTATEYALAVTAYPAWAAKVNYTVGQLVSYAATLYEVIQAHKSQTDWTPPVVPALFVRRSPAGVIPLWVQPTGAHDAYALGALVVFEGQVYESLIAANVWSPTAYPAGWKVR